ncbi:MAG: [acyl-carrier-protein] S-malonyltransferase [Flavobacteriaceae bacterium TMED42]|nr:MAG: [acyl-carrier-protein] S-malonyltransferase [Flavobacteriaceae bacterium TMED42]
MKAYLFPGQGSQFPGMGKDLFDRFEIAKEMFQASDEILGFDLSTILLEGSKEDLQQTRVTQPAIYLHSVITAKVMGVDFQPDAVAGHSLGEFSALTAAGAIDFESGLKLVSKRAEAMQKACNLSEGTMAAVLGLEDNIVEEICQQTAGVVVAANYNCPGQLVISGSLDAITSACEDLKAAGARRALVLPVGGAFHSPLMEPARTELANAIDSTNFYAPLCPIYQNTTASAVSDPEEIQKNLIAQLTAPVRWTQSVNAMIEAGITNYIEVGPGKVLQGLIRKISTEVLVSGAEI